ncbi:MAG: hypothetical protein AABX02_00620 [archaeon]
MDERFGRLRPADVSKLESLIDWFAKAGFRCGLHGTSLWNAKYKDIDLLVFSSKPKSDSFLRTFNKVLKLSGATLIEQRGNSQIGFDMDVRWGRTIFHLSYVVVL